MTLIVPENLTALSNMPEISREPFGSRNSTDGLDIVRFATSPKMSTYLLAVVIGELDYVEGETKSGTLVRVFTPKNEAEGEFALNVSIRLMDFFEDYFREPFSLPKMDQVSI